MTFVVSLIALLVERFFDWSHLRNWRWFNHYVHKMLGRVPEAASYGALAVVVAPIVILTFLSGILLQGWMYGLISLFFQLFVLLYCLGPQNLWADSFGTITGLSAGDAKMASDKLKTSFDIAESGDAPKLHQLLTNGIFVQANNRVFAVAFWFAILGPAGAMLYRLVTLSAQESTLTHSARIVEDVLNWLPARFMTLLFALGGNFVQVMQCWRKKITVSLVGSSQFLIDCGVAALGKEEQEGFALDGSVERNAVGLLDRVFIIWLVIVLIESLLS